MGFFLEIYEAGTKLLENQWIVAVLSGLLVLSVQHVITRYHNSVKKVYFNHKSTPLTVSSWQIGNVTIKIKVGDLEIDNISLQTCMIINRTGRVISDKDFIQGVEVNIPETESLLYYGVVESNVSKSATIVSDANLIRLKDVILLPNEGIIFRYMTGGNKDFLPSAILTDQPELVATLGARPPIALGVSIWGIISVFFIGNLLSGSILIYGAVVGGALLVLMFALWKKLCHSDLEQYFDAVWFAGHYEDISEKGYWKFGGRG